MVYKLFLPGAIDRKKREEKSVFEIFEEELTLKFTVRSNRTNHTTFISVLTAPSQQAEKYQGENGLIDMFFIDTVKNAIKWYSDNKQERE